MIDNDFPVRSSSFAGRPQPQLSIERTPPVTERSMPFAEISRGLGSGSSSPDLRSSDISRHYKNKQRMSRERSIREAAEQRQTERIHQLSVSPTPTSPEFPSAHTSQRSRRGKNKKAPYKKHRDKTKYKHSHRHMDFSDTDSSLDDGLESRPTAQGMESDSSSSVDFATSIFRKRFVFAIRSYSLLKHLFMLLSINGVKFVLTSDAHFLHFLVLFFGNIE